MGNRIPYTDRNEILTLRISKKEKEQLAEMAKKKNLTKSEFIRKLINKARLWR